MFGFGYITNCLHSFLPFFFMRILHIAPENFAGIPIRLVKTERKLGHDSRLITMMRSPQGYEEDICLELPLLRNSFIPTLRSIFSSSTVINSAQRHQGNVHFWKPSTPFHTLFHQFRDFLWEANIISTIEQLGGLDSFDVIIADGGHDLFKVKEYISSSTTPLFCIYYGSDLRTRGLFEHLRSKSLANFTFEFDHTLIDSSIQFLYFPFDKPMGLPDSVENNEFIISHSPTNRKAKGTDKILEVLDQLKDEFSFRIDLIEGVSYQESIHRKAQSSLFIDQIGELGYGVSSLEALSLGVPTAVELLPDFEQQLQPHPFYVLRSNTLLEDLRRTITSIKNNEYDSLCGVKWVQDVHSTSKVVEQYIAKINAVLSV